MAVVPSAGRTVPLYVLIIFVVLFLLATTGLVLLFVNQEGLRQEAQQANTLFDDYIGAGVKSKLDPFKAMAKEMKTTVAGALLQDRNTLAQMVTGNATGTSKEVMDKIQGFASTLSGPEADKLRETAKTDLLGAFRIAVTIAQNSVKESQNLRNELAECQKSKDTVTAGFKDLEGKFTANTEKVMAQLASLQQLFDSYKKDFTDQLESVKSQVSEDLKAKLAKMQESFNLNIDELRDTVRRNIQVLIKSSAELGSADMRARIGMTVDQLLQKADGEVLDIAGPVVYISLGKQQNIQQGMRLVVVSPTDMGQNRPTIKAVLNVTNVGELTSETRVLALAGANPILKGDQLVNLVYDRDMVLNFFVMGEFDLNGDGYIDPNGTQKVSEIISLSGGKVSKQLSPEVNFVVLGTAPVKPEKEPGENEEAKAEYEKQLKAIQHYNDLTDQVKALAIPTISSDLFLKYTGYVTNLK
jgi:gas vesicle protein